MLKITTASKANRESEGDQRARQTWLKPYLPDFFLPLIGDSDDRAGLLMSLARDRLENCETLHASLSRSFGYAKKYVLWNVVNAYCKEASRHWPDVQYRPVRENFRKCVEHGLPDGWARQWQENSFPPAESDTVVFEASSDRWPNPVAYFSRSDLWPTDDEFGVSIPWIPSHGDLNCRNVLCPSVDRSLALSLTTGAEQPLVGFGQRMLSHISLIDTPFCREAPFTFDLAFLGTWLSFLLPPFEIASTT